MQSASLSIKLLLVGLLATIQCWSQNTVAIGEWRSHLPYFNVNHVEQSQEKVYYATDESLLIFDKDDGSLDFMSKVDGLSQADIQSLLYDSDNEQLIIAYGNSTFDIVSDEGIITVTDIDDKSDIQGDKQIYDMYVQNGKYLYLAMGFGLVQYDLISNEFGFTMDISTQVFSVDGEGEEIIIALADGAFALDISTTNIPGFFDEWESLDSGIPAFFEPTDVFMLRGNRYVASEKVLYVADASNNFDTLYINDFDGFDINFINPTADGWMLGMIDENGGGRGKLIQFDATDTEVAFADDCFRNILDADMDNQGRIFTTELWDGIFYREAFNGSCREIVVNSPFSREVSDLSIFRDQLYVASGGVRDNFGDNFSRNGFYIFEDETWTNVNERANDFMRDNEILQVFKVAARPDGDKVYFGSFWAGLVEYDVETQELELYNEQNSKLDFLVGDRRVRISGLAFDNDNNLWISNFGAPEPLVVMTPEGEWYDYDIPGTDTRFTDIAIDDSGIVWVTVGGSQGGLALLDPGESLSDPGTTRIINRNNSVIESTTINTVRKDDDGAVWVGTGEGVVVFECGGSAMEDDCVGNLRRVTVDNILANLLATEDVLSIAFDGANRKWFGTRSGIFVMSPDGEEQIAQFNVDNSPLFDNLVRAMEFNGESGEMFIASDKGIQSIRTETTSATDRHAAEVFAFPNPVRPDYRGPIAIKGLARDAEVRITDIDGKLVHKTRALGGQAIWDGLNLEGNEVVGGIYLVFSSSTDVFRDPDTNVAKIMIVR